MQYESMFDKLVMDLSSRERKELLEKLRDSNNVSIEPLVFEVADEREVSLEQAYSKLGLFDKVVLFIKTFFTGRKRESLVEELLLKKLADRIAKKNPNLMSFQRRQLLEGFIKELESLQMHLTPLAVVFAKSLEKTRGAFYAFLVSLEFESLNERLVEETDPTAFYSEERFKDVAAVKGEMEHRFKSIIEGISAEDRTRFHHGTLALFHLYKLMTFRFDEIIPAPANRAPGKRAISYNPVKRELNVLCDLLASTTYPPPSNVLKAVFLFSSQDTAGETGQKTEAQIDEFISEVDVTLGIIRQFNASVPLADMIRCLSKNYTYKPLAVKGGEDWFVQFKTYWEQKIEDRFKEFYREKKVKILLENSLAFLESDFFTELSNYRQYDEENKFVKFPLTLSFIKNFTERVFLPKIGKPLKTLLLNGNFYKKQNRSEFTDAYNNVTLLPDKINALDADLAPEGDIGIRIRQVELEIKQNKLRHKQIATLSKEIDDAAKRIIEECMRGLATLSSVVDGVLFGQIGGKFDTISNLKNIGGKENAELLASLKGSITILNRGQEYVREFFQVESRTSGAREKSA